MAGWLILSGIGATASAEPVPAKQSGDYKLAEAALLQGRLSESTMRLQGMIAADPRDAASRLLLCRALYAADEIDNAVAACEGALALAPGNSQMEDWLGRVEGIKADRSGPITGFQLAKKVRASFEAAVAADPRNADAVSDLTDYYVAAPALVGGGTDKADALADRVAHDLPQQAHRTRALAAEKRKEYDAAEREFRAAIAVALRPDAWVDLATFFQRRHMDDKSLDAVQHCLAADRAHGPATVDAATVLHDLHREQRLAEQSLRLYLAGNARTDDAPAPRVHVLLGKMLAEDGDKAAAKTEFEAALTLSRNYAPATRALREL